MESTTTSRTAEANGLLGTRAGESAEAPADIDLATVASWMLSRTGEARRAGQPELVVQVSVGAGFWQLRTAVGESLAMVEGRGGAGSNAWQLAGWIACWGIEQGFATRVSPGGVEGEVAVGLRPSDTMS